MANYGIVFKITTLKAMVVAPGVLDRVIVLPTPASVFVAALLANEAIVKDMDGYTQTRTV